MYFERHLFALQFVNGFFEQPDVRVEAHGLDVTVLLAAQQIAGAAQFEIERGDLEARAQIAEFFQRGQTLARDLAQLRVGRAPEDKRTRGDSSGPRVRATDTARLNRSARRSR